MVMTAAERPSADSKSAILELPDYLQQHIKAMQQANIKDSFFDLDDTLITHAITDQGFLKMLFGPDTKTFTDPSKPTSYANESRQGFYFYQNLREMVKDRVTDPELVSNYFKALDEAGIRVHINTLNSSTLAKTLCEEHGWPVSSISAADGQIIGRDKVAEAIDSENGVSKHLNTEVKTEGRPRKIAATESVLSHFGGSLDKTAFFDDDFSKLVSSTRGVLEEKGAHVLMQSQEKGVRFDSSHPGFANEIKAKTAQLKQKTASEFQAQQVASPVVRESPYVNKAAIEEAKEEARRRAARGDGALVSNEPAYANSFEARREFEAELAAQEEERRQDPPPVPETPRPKNQSQKQDPPPVPETPRPKSQSQKQALKAAVNDGVAALGAALRTYIKNSDNVSITEPGRARGQFNLMNIALKNLGQQEITDFNFTEAIKQLTKALSAQGVDKDAIKRAANPASGRRFVLRTSEGSRREAAGQLYEHIAASLNKQESSTDPVNLGLIRNSAIRQKLQYASENISPRRDSIDNPPRLGTMNINSLNPRSRANSVSSNDKPLPPLLTQDWTTESSIYATVVNPSIAQEAQDFQTEVDKLMAEFTKYKEQNRNLPEITQKVFAAADKAEDPHHKLIFLKMFRGLELARRDLERDKRGELIYATLADTLELPEINIETTRRRGEDIYVTEGQILAPMDSLYSTVNKVNKITIPYSYEGSGKSIGDQEIDVSNFSSKEEREALIKALLYEGKLGDERVGARESLGSALKTTIPVKTTTSAEDEQQETPYAVVDFAAKEELRASQYVRPFKEENPYHNDRLQRHGNRQDPTRDLARQNSNTGLGPVHAARPVPKPPIEVELEKQGAMGQSSSDYKLVFSNNQVQLHRTKGETTVVYSVTPPPELTPESFWSTIANYQDAAITAFSGNNAFNLVHGESNDVLRYDIKHIDQPKVDRQERGAPTLTENQGQIPAKGITLRDHKPRPLAAGVDRSNSLA